MKKIKVLLFTDTFCDLNGVSRFIQDISLIAKRRDLLLHVVTSSAITECPEMQNVTILKPTLKTRIPFYPELHLVLPSYAAIKKVTDEVSPDLIHVSTPGFVGLMGRRIAKKRGIPMLGTYHTDFPQFAYKNVPMGLVKRTSEKMMSAFYKDFCAVFVRSEAYRQIVRKDVGVDDDLIYTLKAGIDTGKFNPEHRDMSIWESYGIPKDAVKALYVGRLTKEKNFPLLLSLWKRHFQNSQNKLIYLVVVGGDVDQSICLERYHIKVLGTKRGEALSQLYAGSDFFLFPSTTDTLGQVVMEAMSSALPVVVSDQGGPATLIDTDAPGGYAIDTTDENAWLETMKRLTQDADLRRRLGENGERKIASMGIEKSFDAFWEVHRLYA